MEEQKTTSKKIEMKGTKAAGESQPQKLTYEELNQACADMSQQLQNQNRYILQMRQQMQQMESALMSKRMDYLFKVVEMSAGHVSLDNLCFPWEFVEQCIAEIQETLTISPEEEPEQEKENN